MTSAIMSTSQFEYYNSSSASPTITTVAAGADDDIAMTSSLLEYAAVRFTFIACYALIFVLGFCGNALVVFVVLRNKTMQTITNIFILNLAVSDILMCLLAVPFTPMSAFVDDWFLGETLCRLVPMSLGTTVYVSTLTSTAIAIDRYVRHKRPF